MPTLWQADLMPLASKLIGNQNPVKQISFYSLTVVHKYGWSLGNSSRRTVVYEGGERIFRFKRPVHQSLRLPTKTLIVLSVEHSWPPSPWLLRECAATSQ